MLGTREYTLCSPFRANAHNSSYFYYFTAIYNYISLSVALSFNKRHFLAFNLNLAQAGNVLSSRLFVHLAASIFELNKLNKIGGGGGNCQCLSATHIGNRFILGITSCVIPRCYT